MRFHAIALLVLMVPIGVSHAETFGDENEESYNLSIEGLILGWSGPPSSSGTLDSIKVLLDVTTAAHNVHCAIYKLSDTTLIDSSEVKSIGVGSGVWHSFDLKMDGEIQAGTVYAIVAQAEANGGDVEMYFNITGNAWLYKSTVYDAWPDTLHDCIAPNTRDVSIFAYYTPAAVGPVNVLHSAAGAGVLHSAQGASVLHEP